MALTVEQRKKIDAALAPLKAEGLRIDSINKDECIAAFNAAYAAQNLKSPEYEFFISPWAALQRVESMVPDKSKYKVILGDEVKLWWFDWGAPDLKPAYDDPQCPSISNRVEKTLAEFKALDSTVGLALQIATSRGMSDSMVYEGNSSFWQAVEDLGMLKSFAALGMATPPEDFTLGCTALGTCGCAFTYERICFISDRPQSIEDSKLTTGLPSDRISILWRDGFKCDGYE